jgi:hypothetical protein
LPPTTRTRPTLESARSVSLRKASLGRDLFIVGR